MDSVVPPIAAGERPTGTGREGDALADRPNWYYLLRELDGLYRYQSAGGSAIIRGHMREVRTRLNRVLERQSAFIPPAPSSLPVCVHLDRAVDNGLRERTASVIRAFRRIRAVLGWQYGYERMPRGLANKYAYAELLGPNGPVVANDLVLGAVLFAPRCTYPAHSHPGITESYVCLSGAISENDAGVYAPGSLIFNPPGHEHRITTGVYEPSLLTYAWIGDPEVLGRPMMRFQRRTKRAGSVAHGTGEGKTREA